MRPVNTILRRQSSTTQVMRSTEIRCVCPFLYILAQIDIKSITTYNLDRNTRTVYLDSLLQTIVICRNCQN
jgi:hypothetical protein